MHDSLKRIFWNALRDRIVRFPWETAPFGAIALDLRLWSAYQIQTISTLAR